MQSMPWEFLISDISTKFREKVCFVTFMEGMSIWCKTAGGRPWCLKVQYHIESRWRKSIFINRFHHSLFVKFSRRLIFRTIRSLAHQSVANCVIEGRNDCIWCKTAREGHDVLRFNIIKMKKIYFFNRFHHSLVNFCQPRLIGG